MLTEYLSAEHFDVKSVHDGGDALAELKSNEFEILILDVMLPSVERLRRAAQARRRHTTRPS